MVSPVRVRVSPFGGVGSGQQKLFPSTCRVVRHLVGALGDAERVLRLLMPTLEEEEPLRDLVSAREDVRGDRR